MGPDPKLPRLNARRRHNDLAITLVALALLLLWDASRLDLTAVRVWGDARGFAWREHWLTARVLHDGGRWLAGGVLLAMVAVALRPSWLPALGRAERWRALAATVIALLVVPVLKHYSDKSCPWDLAEFGGVARYLSHWDFGHPDGGGGRCFPSGHATSAFAFFSAWFVLRDPYPRLGRAWLGAVLVLGTAYGWAQMARGAHYPSHTMWSAWICWTLALLVTRVGTPSKPVLAADADARL